MKKAFILLCSVLPGGLILLGVILTFSACARLQFQDPAGSVKISGYTTTPEMAMVMSAEAEVVRAQAYATRKCSDDPNSCGALWGSWGASYGMDTPAGYTWAGIRAAGADGIDGGKSTESSEIRKDVARIKKSLGLTIRAIKKGN